MGWAAAHWAGVMRVMRVISFVGGWGKCGANFGEARPVVEVEPEAQSCRGGAGSVASSFGRGRFGAERNGTYAVFRTNSRMTLRKTCESGSYRRIGRRSGWSRIAASRLVRACCGTKSTLRIHFTASELLPQWFAPPPAVLRTFSSICYSMGYVAIVSHGLFDNC